VRDNKETRSTNTNLPLPKYSRSRAQILSPIPLPNGTITRFGTYLAVDSSPAWSSKFHNAPEASNAHCFLALRESTGSPTYAFTASSAEHNTFGMGRFMCPGRFIVDTELKLVLAKVLSEYEARVVEGYAVEEVYAGLYPVVSSGAKIEVRRIRR
jgi:hypothetical protein